MNKTWMKKTPSSKPTFRHHNKNLPTCKHVLAVTKPYVKHKVRFKKLASRVATAHERIDDALGVISLNGTILQSVVTDAHNVDKYQHGIQMLQNDFLFASKFMLVSRVIGSLKATDTQKSLNVAIYISLLFLVIFVSDH